MQTNQPYLRGLLSTKLSGIEYIIKPTFQHPDSGTFGSSKVQPPIITFLLCDFGHIWEIHSSHTDARVRLLFLHSP